MTVCSPDLKEERRLRKEGHEWVAGLDEVGRGAWAGPITVGVAVVRPRVQMRSAPAWLRDSKMLSEGRREQIFDAVARWCAAWSVGHATAAECDAWGMTEALRVAARRALAGLAEQPSAVLVDGPVDVLRHAEDPFGGFVRPIVDGDAKCASVAAASVLAKVVRDRLMREEAPHFPAYGFERNKGYPSPLHQAALRGYGPSALHRRSWAFVRDLPWCGQPWLGRRRPDDDQLQFDFEGADWPEGSDDGGDLGEMAGDGMPLATVDESGLLGGADLLRLPAPRAEAAARGG
jgi:ribonuclease HII